MKITKSKIKSLIKEIIRVHEEQNIGTEWEVRGDEVYIHELDMPAGGAVDVRIEFDGEWDTSAFGYEYGSIRGIHKHPFQFEIANYSIREVSDSATGNELWSYKRGGPTIAQSNPVLFEVIEKFWKTIEREVENKVSDIRNQS